MFKNLFVLFGFLILLSSQAIAQERFAGLVIVGGGYALSNTVSNVVLLRSDTATHGVNFTYPIYDRDVLNKVTPGFSVQDGFTTKIGQETSSVAYSYTKPLVGLAFTDTKAELEFKVNHKLPYPYSGILFRPAYDLRHIIGGASSGFFLLQGRYYWPTKF